MTDCCWLHIREDFPLFATRKDEYFMLSDTKDKRKMKLWEWIPKVMRFNSERRILASFYRSEGNTFWATIVERIKVPIINKDYLGNPEDMPASFYVPKFTMEGRHLRKFVCNAGELREIIIYMLYVIGFTDESIPEEFRELLDLLK